ncbi:unnamed protein product, partial [Nesidiocoris tenuis]
MPSPLRSTVPVPVPVPLQRLVCSWAGEENGLTCDTAYRRSGPTTLFTWRTVDRIRSASHWSTGERAPFTTATAPRAPSRRPIRGRPYRPDPVNRMPCEPSFILLQTTYGVRRTDKKFLLKIRVLELLK